MEDSEACDVVVSDDTGGGGEVMVEWEGGGSIRIFFAGCENKRYRITHYYSNMYSIVIYEHPQGFSQQGKEGSHPYFHVLIPLIYLYIHVGM